MSDDLVACEWCGVVYVLDTVAVMDHCPTCDNTKERTRSIPCHGNVYKWWEYVDRS